MKKVDYSKLFTLRKDGRYQTVYHDSTGKLCYLYDRDPERLYRTLGEKTKPTHATLKEMADGWESEHRDDIKDRTWKNYKPHVEDLIARYGKNSIDSISAAEIDADLKQLKAKQYSKTVVNTRKVVWTGILNYALANDKIKFNPAMSVKLPKGLKAGKRKAPDDDMVNTILSEANDMKFGFIPFFLLCTGMRRTEALSTLKKNVDMDKWEIYIPEAKTEAGIRAVPVIAPLRKPLQAWVGAHPGPWLFPYISYNGRAGTHMTDSNWETAWATFCRRHGWEDGEGKPTIGAHNLRHGTATLLYDAGVDVYTAQHILGHANVSTTMEIYTELREEKEKRNISKFANKMSKRMSKTAK